MFWQTSGIRQAAIRQLSGSRQAVVKNALNSHDSLELKLVALPLKLKALLVLSFFSYPVSLMQTYFHSSSPISLILGLLLDSS